MQLQENKVSELMEERRYAEVVDALGEACGIGDSTDSAVDAAGATAEQHALLGLALFQLQRYTEADAQLSAALKQQPDETAWHDLREQARLNAISEVDVVVPEVYHFEREKLLAAADIPEGTLPKPPSPLPPAEGINWFRLKLGNFGGSVLGSIMHVGTWIWGKLAGYRDVVWTNWYRRPLFYGIMTLAYMRDRLNRRNLRSTYPEGALIGFQEPGQTPPEGATHFRTANGSWNNFDNPMEGAAGTRFSRNVEDSAIQPETGEQLMTPNPREISRKLLTREESAKEVPFLNLLAASWIQFQNHGWVNHGEILWNDFHEIPLPEGDPARRKYHQTKLFVGKSQPDPTRQEDGETTPATYINEVTHWWDGSQIYGSDQETQDRLRSGVDGKMNMRLTGDGKTLLPLDKHGVEDTGFVRNWWIGLSMFHTLFTLEHNAICDHLKMCYPHWDDNRLFNVARLINGAVMAKIHTVEWTPAVLPNPGLDAALNANWFGIANNLFHYGKNRQTLATIKLRSPELGGVVGNELDKHGQPYSLTEEFVEVYRLHSFLPEELHLRELQSTVEANDDGPVTEKVPLPATRQAGSRKLAEQHSMAKLFFSFGNQHPGQLVLNNFPRFMQELSIPGNPVYDMGAVDILRARERGVPRYNEFRRQLGLNPIRTFDDLTGDAEQVAQIKEVYGDKPEDVEKLDLLIGTLAEGHRPSGFGFGETLFQIFILNATRRLQADRFFTDNYNQETYTREGLQWIDGADLKTVLLRHYPELAATGLSNITNAFEPWDCGDQLDPDRHCLREYNKMFRGDPWTGDAKKSLITDQSAAPLPGIHPLDEKVIPPSRRSRQDEPSACQNPVIPELSLSRPLRLRASA